MALIAHSSPDQGETLQAVLRAAALLPPEAGLAALTEALRAEGVELGEMMAEMAAEPPSDPDLARRELAGALRQTQMKALKAEQEKLAGAGLASEADRARYREIAAALEKLRVDADNDQAA